MPVLQRVVKPKTQRGKRALLKREPKLIEDAKLALCIKGRNASQVGTNFMKDLYDLKKPNAQMMQRKNDISPFEDVVPIEQFENKLNASLFMVATHNKKRPHNIVFGRMYERTLLDMAEFGIEDYKSLREFKGEKITSGIKPVLIFNGELFENNYDYKRIKNLLIDMFQREVVDNVRLQGLEHVLSFTATDNKILLRSYRIKLKKSETRLPRIELEEIGPRANLCCRRTQFASEDLFKLACKKPKELKVKTKKNLSKDKLGTTFGRIHVGSQNIKTIQTRKMKGLKKTVAEKRSELKRKQSNNAEDANKKQKLAVKE